MFVEAFGINVERDPAIDGFNQYVINLTSVDSGTGAQRGFQLFIDDALGGATNIFSNPSGGLDLNQEINWFAQGASAGFRAFELDDGFNTVTNINARLTSLTISSSPAPVPEPGTLALVALSAAALGCTRRRRSAGAEAR